MATERVPMRKIRVNPATEMGGSAQPPGSGAEPGREPRRVASAPGPRRTADLEAVEALSDDALSGTLYGPTAAEVDGARPEPDLASIHQELRRPGVTLELLHVEYLAAHPTGVPLTRRSVTGIAPGGRGSGCRCARSTRLARRPSSTTPACGPRSSTPPRARSIAVELFVAVLGASSFTFAEADPDATERWTGFDEPRPMPSSTLRAACRRCWVPDPLRTGVTVPSAADTEPGVQRIYAELAQHLYDTVDDSGARPAKPSSIAKRSRSPSKSPSAGFWRDCAMRPSSASPR